MVRPSAIAIFTRFTCCTSCNSDTSSGNLLPKRTSTCDSCRSPPSNSSCSAAALCVSSIRWRDARSARLLRTRLTVGTPNSKSGARKNQSGGIREAVHERALLTHLAGTIAPRSHNRRLLLSVQWPNNTFQQQGAGWPAGPNSVYCCRRVIRLQLVPGTTRDRVISGTCCFRCATNCVVEYGGRCSSEPINVLRAFLRHGNPTRRRAFSYAMGSFSTAG
mmetsp:Transcript_54859/g.163185  ORF Transcript_54859/g.163185 Transcript_54859/m.163185 type:complete len:219 (-) Transcript_54859:1665-2321(-)